VPHNRLWFTRHHRHADVHGDAASALMVQLRLSRRRRAVRIHDLIPIDGLSWIVKLRLLRGLHLLDVLLKERMRLGVLVRLLLLASFLFAHDQLQFLLQPLQFLTVRVVDLGFAIVVVIIIIGFLVVAILILAAAFLLVQSQPLLQLEQFLLDAIDGLGLDDALVAFFDALLLVLLLPLLLLLFVVRLHTAAVVRHGWCCCWVGLCYGIVGIVG